VTTRDTILDAAADVLRRLGMANATTREIARAAGYSEATLYKHFADKSEIFLAVLKERLPALSHTLDELTASAGSGTVGGNLTTLAHTAMAFYTEMFPIAVSLFSSHLLLAEHRRRLAELGSGPEQVVHGVTQYLMAEQRQGRILDGVDLDAPSQLLVGACFHHAFLVNLSGQQPSETELTRTATELVSTLMRSLAPAT
jgi:AcrR family transcriptional regulator